MPLHLNELSKTDGSDLYLLPTLADIHLRAWLTNPLFRSLYYGPPESHTAIIDANIRRHRAALLDDPSARYVVVLHSDVPEAGDPWKVISFVKFNVFPTVEALQARKDTAERQWPPYTNLALLKDFWGRIVKVREKSAGDLGPHVCVDLLATDPDFQRLGAGRMLMQYVMCEVDRLGLPCMLEGSPGGLKLYESVGLRVVGDLWVDLKRFENGGDKGEAWRGDADGEMRNDRDGWYSQVIMVRPAKQTLQHVQ